MKNLNNQNSVKAMNFEVKTLSSTLILLLHYKAK